jgi:hypothetical protein
VHAPPGGKTSIFFGGDEPEHVPQKKQQPNARGNSDSMTAVMNSHADKKEDQVLLYTFLVLLFRNRCIHLSQI